MRAILFLLAMVLGGCISPPREHFTKRPILLDKAYVDFSDPQLLRHLRELEAEIEIKKAGANKPPGFAYSDSERAWLRLLLEKRIEILEEMDRRGLSQK